MSLLAISIQKIQTLARTAYKKEKQTDEYKDCQLPLVTLKFRGLPDLKMESNFIIH